MKDRIIVTYQTPTDAEKRHDGKILYDDKGNVLHYVNANQIVKL